MRVRILLVVCATLVLAAVTTAQCAKPEMLVQWDDSKHDFVCVSGGGNGTERFPIDHSFPGKTFESDQDQNDFCAHVFATEVKNCKPGANGALCRKQARANKGICGGKAGAPSGSTTDPPTAQPKPTAASCKKTFSAQVKFCKDHKPAISSPGEPPHPNTCLADAVAARDACLANSQ
jgi:hypothetical protein